MEAPSGDTKDFEEVVQTVSHDQSYAEEGLEMQKSWHLFSGIEHYFSVYVKRRQMT